MANYKASISRTKGKEALSIIFRHPVKIDPKTNYGIRVRRGLGTSDEAIAQRLVAQMNELLSDFTMWSIDKKPIAYQKYSPIIVDAFYDFLESSSLDYQALINSKIELPTRTNDYGTALFIGQSGAGKTSVLRCLMGTQNDKFPTTSTGRTTTSTMEVILSQNSEYELVVTFMSREKLSLYVKECVQNAVSYCVEKENQIRTIDVIEKLLTHKELTVRLSYILGHPSMIKSECEEDDYQDEDEDEDEGNKSSTNTTDDLEIDDQQCKEMVSKIQEKADKVVQISEDYIKTKNNDAKDDDVVDDDNLEIFLEKSDLFNDVIDDIVDEIQDRFKILVNGQVVSETRGWINVWYYKTKNREEFIKQAKRFSSNNKSQWGTLLTPIVQFIRVKGMFKPEFCNNVPRLVLIDGLGLGHKITASSLSAETTSRFKNVDTIVLVDNAVAPMMDNAKLALRTIVESGHTNKLSVCFTHMDELKGDNFISRSDKIRHVESSLESYVTSLREQNPPVISSNGASSILGKSLYMWNLDKEIKKFTQTQLESLIAKIQTSIPENTKLEEIRLSYDILMLYPYLQQATKQFRDSWRFRLGIPNKTEKTEHWSRIKALSRRLATMNESHYSELMPIEDLLREITAQLNIFISNPTSCQPSTAPEELQQIIEDKIKSNIHSKMHNFVINGLWKESGQLANWMAAYNYGGYYGSTRDRANKIDNIFQVGAPNLDNYAPNTCIEQKEFIEGVVSIIKIGVEEENGKLVASSFTL